MTDPTTTRTTRTTESPWDLLGRLQSIDPGRPRLTWYDDEPGPTSGERIELSARVLINWVSKAGNLLQDDFAAGPGTSVWLDLPAHWRSVYWAFAAWSVGATVVLTPGDTARDDAGHDTADVVVTVDPATAAAAVADAVLVCQPALARAHPEAAAAPSAVDEARELSTHGDQFTPMEEPTPSDDALRVGGDSTAYGDLVAPQGNWGLSPRIAVQGDLAAVLQHTLSAFAADGSVVLTRGATDDASRLRAEGVTLDLR
ncbi:MAG: TIGR03089 family protein [Dermatophilaceae bacterium]